MTARELFGRVDIEQYVLDDAYLISAERGEIDWSGDYWGPLERSCEVCGDCESPGRETFLIDVTTEGGSIHVRCAGPCLGDNEGDV